MMYWVGLGVQRVGAFVYFEHSLVKVELILNVKLYIFNINLSVIFHLVTKIPVWNCIHTSISAIWKKNVSFSAAWATVNI